jgi:hypothetical protein
MNEIHMEYIAYIYQEVEIPGSGFAELWVRVISDFIAESILQYC